jgi:hypothetical protein
MVRSRAIVLVLLVVPLLVGRVDTASAQVRSRIGTAFTMIDAESRTYFEAGAEAPVRGNGPLTGYPYLLLTRPHFLDQDLYLRMAVAPVYVTAELIRDHWPFSAGAIGVGLGGGLYGDSHAEFRSGRFEDHESFSGHSAGGTLAYYLRAPKIGGFLPVEGQIRLRPKYVAYDRTSDTSRRFRVPEDSAIYEGRAGVRVGGVPPELFPSAAMELSLWHGVGYRTAAGGYGLPERPEETVHLTQRTWTRLGEIYTFGGTQASVFLNAGIAEDTDPLSAFRLGGGLRMRDEFPLLLHGYNVDEVSARRYFLVNASYRFPIWPGQDRVDLELAGDYALVDYIRGHRLPHTGLAGVGANLSFALSKRITLVVGYGYGVDAPRNHGFGGHEVNTLFEFRY